MDKILNTLAASCGIALDSIAGFGMLLELDEALESATKEEPSLAEETFWADCEAHKAAPTPEPMPESEPDWLIECRANFR